MPHQSLTPPSGSGTTGVADHAATARLADRVLSAISTSLVSQQTFDFYIDSVNGVDTNAGTSPDLPWKTLAKITASGLAAGQTVGLRRGSVFREALPTPVSGTRTAPVIYGAYGVGAQPRIKGSVDYSAAAWSVSSGSIYVATVAGLPAASNVAYLTETTPLALAASVGAMTAGTYFPDVAGGHLYVWLPDGSSPQGKQIEVNGNVSTICSTNKNYVTFQDLAIMHGSGSNAGIFAFNSTVTRSMGIVVRRCTIGPHKGVGIACYAYGSIIEDNLVQNCWDAIEYPNSSANGMGIVLRAAPVSTSMTSIVRRNQVTGCYYGIRIENGAKDVYVYNNFVYLNHVNGIDNNGGAAPIYFLNNTIWHRPTSIAGHGIDVQAGDGFVCQNNIVYCDFTGTNSNVQAIDVSAGAAANISVDYNVIYLAAGSTASFGKVNNTQYPDLASFLAALNTTYPGSGGTHNQQADPQLRNLAGGDATPLASSPAIGGGIAWGGVTDQNFGSVSAGAYQPSV